MKSTLLPLAIVAVGCGATRLELPTEVAGDLPPDGGTESIRYVTTVPRQHAFFVPTTVHVAFLDGGVARAGVDYDLAWGEGFPERSNLELPRRLTIPMPALDDATLAFVGVTGPADVVTHSLVGQTLSVVPRAEGATRLTVSGVASTELLDGGTVAFPFELSVGLRVHRVSGVQVESFQQTLFSCPGALTVAAGAPVWLPNARLIDPSGMVFDAANAPRPVALDLESSSRVELDQDAQHFSVASPGVVRIVARTQLPVVGLTEVTALGPDALRTVPAKFILIRPVNKGSLYGEIVEGTSYPVIVPFGNPDEPVTVEFRVESPTVEAGRVCSVLPASWFVVTSDTPSVCSARSLGARVLTDGECRLRVALPGTTFTWATRFSTLH